MNDEHIRQQLVNALTLRQAHLSFETAVAVFPAAHYNSRVPEAPYTFWHLLEHLRITQADILDYIENPNYQYMKWPEDYWPTPAEEADELKWRATLSAFEADRAALVDIINDRARDLCAQIPHGQPGHSILREILVIAAHNSYHIGELGSLRGTLGLW